MPNVRVSSALSGSRKPHSAVSSGEWSWNGIQVAFFGARKRALILKFSWNIIRLSSLILAARQLPINVFLASKLSTRLFSLGRCWCCCFVLVLAGSMVAISALGSRIPAVSTVLVYMCGADNFREDLSDIFEVERIGGRVHWRRNATCRLFSLQSFWIVSSIACLSTAGSKCDSSCRI